MDFKLIITIVFPYLALYILVLYVDYKIPPASNCPIIHVPLIFRKVLFPINSKLQSHSIITIILSGTSVIFILYTLIGVALIHFLAWDCMHIHLLICAILASCLLAIDGIILALLYAINSDFSLAKKSCICILLVLLAAFLICSSMP